jgi:hypothetical protein
MCATGDKHDLFPRLGESPAKIATYPTDTKDGDAHGDLLTKNASNVHQLAEPNAGAHLLPEAGATQERTL